MRARTSLILLTAWVSLVGAAESPEQWRADGLAAYERGHDAEAMSYFRRAAEAGDARSAEILALMHRLGPALYAGVPVDAGEAGKWAAIAAEARRAAPQAPIAAR